MKILFLHQNFPAQFRQLVEHLRQDPSNELIALRQPNSRIEMEGVAVVPYRYINTPLNNQHPLLGEMEAKVIRAEAVADACTRLKMRGWSPDVIIAHPGWGEALMIKDVWPKAKLVCYFEYFYNTTGQDLDFDPEFTNQNDSNLLAKLRLKNTVMLHALHEADAGWSPTAWQRNTFPEWARSKIDVIHEGIDTDYFAPNPDASFSIANKGLFLTRQDEIITYAARSLEPVRGFHIFMRALPELLKKRPKAHVIIMGGEKATYGQEPQGYSSWLQKMLHEVGSQLDPTRVHLVGFLPKEQYRAVLQVSSAHVYLTYPFLLSWSMLEAMACGAPIAASNTGPVTEIIEDGKNGVLFDFFSPQDLCKKAIALVSKKKISSTYGQAGRETVIEQFDAKNCIQTALSALGLTQTSKRTSSVERKSKAKKTPAVTTK